jgi:hypothetical protein
MLDDFVPPREHLSLSYAQMTHKKGNGRIAYMTDDRIAIE